MRNICYDIEKQNKKQMTKLDLKIPAFWLVNVQLKIMKKLLFAFTLAIPVVF